MTQRHSIDEHSEWAALLNVPDPVTGCALTAPLARWQVDASGAGVEVFLTVGYPTRGLAERIRAAVGSICEARGRPLTQLHIEQRIAAHAVQDKLAPVPGIKNVIAVGSGKGGVGKSTTTVNLALALQMEGARVGILDADVYGPSIPTMLGLSGQPVSLDEKTVQPMQGFSISAMSIGLLVDPDAPMVWRGPMATSALMQLFKDTQWDALDYLLIDLPPGTGDIQLTLAQKIPVSGAVIVTTPQEVATLDARRALKMFEKVQVPVLGIVENMAIHICSECGHVEHIFGEGGGQMMAETYGVPLLGSLPLNVAIRQRGDTGTPIVAAEPDSVAAKAYYHAALTMAAELAARPRAPAAIASTLA